ncbi:hypothetical protein [Pseudomonas paraveronii]|uniref:hypothetical protein n=1 Tax=Pseudomonas paraveronii TaxID=3040598 RepID=UPI002AB2F63F|nr:hypothetical protein [Pseudomonas sp. V3/K/3/5]
MTISSSLAHALSPHPSTANDTLEPAAQVAVAPDRKSPHLSAPGNSPRARGDSELAQNYGKTLLGFSGVPAHDNAIMVDIPPDSTFGQWWNLLGDAARSPEFLDWRRQVRALPSSIKIVPQSGQVTYRVTPDVSPNTPLQLRASDDKHWSAVRGPLMDAGGIISDRNRPFPLPLSGSTNRAPAWLVGQFYQEPTRIAPSDFQQRAAELERDKTFAPLDPAVFPGLQEKRSEDALKQQQTLLGNINNRHQAAVLLKHLGTVLASGALELSQVPAYLRETTFELNPHSSYEQDRGAQDGGLVSLADFLEYHGFEKPRTAQEVENLKLFLLAPTPRSPAHGNYGGALSWPQPIGTDTQRQLLAFLQHGNVGDLNLGSNRNVLEALMQGVAVEAHELRNPRQLLDRIIQSPKGQALGAAIQAKFNTLSVKGSVNDWLMAALNLNYTDAFTQANLPQKHISGFDLAGQQLKGKPLSETAQRVADHLYYITKEASSPEKALIQANLKLASKAPELLVKDIPATVTHGSPAHVSFSTAVARIEAETPGRASTMSYGEVMLYADIAPVSQAQRQIEYVAQHEALKEWGLTNRIVTSVTSPADMQTITDAFNQQAGELRAASEAQRTPVPASRKELALAELRKALGDDVHLELKCIVLGTYDKDRPGPYSILDLYMENMLHNPPKVPYHPARRDNRPRPNQWVIEPYTPPRRGPGRSAANTPNFTLEEVLSKTQNLKNISREFVSEFKRFGQALDSSVATQVKHLIAQLPLEDRQNIEYGGLSIFKEFHGERQASGIVRVPAAEGNPVLLKVMRDGVAHAYELNVQKNTLTKRRDLGDFQPGYQPGPHIEDGKPRDNRTPYTDMVPVTLSIRDESSAVERQQLLQEKTDTGGPLNSFASPRSAAIGATVAKVSSVWGALEAEARGVTTVESEVPFYRKLSTFLLDLIPFRSAINNFIDGNIGEGIVDLSLDIFGVLTAGTATVGKAAKIATSTLSAGGKVLRTAKTLGLGAISLVNPLDGATDLLRVTGRGLASAGKRVITDTIQDLRKLRGTHTRYDLVAASKQYDAAAMGTFKTSGETLQGSAVLQDGKWYAFDTVTQRPFGKVLDDFQPSIRGGSPELHAWQNMQRSPSPASIQIRKDWEILLDRHHGDGTPSAAFESGYEDGVPELIKGYVKGMKSEDVMKLALHPDRTAQEVGTLVRQQERLAVQHGLNGTQHFNAHVNAVGGTFTPVPQAFYLSQVNRLSEGQCAALTRTFASAKAHGKERVFIDNLYVAAADPRSEEARVFTRTLGDVQKSISTPTMFHAGNPQRQVTYQDMITELANAPGGKTVMIDSPGHAMLAGSVPDGDGKKFFFYDPNFGVAEFSSEAMMKRGLEKIFNSKNLPVQYKTYSNDPKKLEFKISDHNESWIGTASLHDRPIKRLYEDPIPTIITNVEPPAQTHYVHMSDYTDVTVTDPTSIISTRGIGDCSALAVLTDLKDGVYRKRTLLHFPGGTPTTEQHRVLKQLEGELDQGSKVIYVGGDNVRSIPGLGIALKQSHTSEQVVFNIANKYPASTTIATANRIDIKPDGSFELFEGTNPARVLDPHAKAEVLAW